MSLRQLVKSQPPVNSSVQNTSGSQVYVLLNKMRERARIYINSRSQDSFNDIIGALDNIKIILAEESSTRLRDILSQIEMKDKELWKMHQWELVDTQDWNWHENNDPQSLKRKWITPDIIMTMGSRAKTNKLVTIILNMAAIYWVTPGILRNPPKPR